MPASQGDTERFLVVGNQTLGGERLMDWLRGAVARGPCSLHILVPATVDPHEWIYDDESDRALAASRLEKALQRFAELGVDVTGEVGDNRPVDAILDVVRREPFDMIVLSTLPAGVSRWLRLDLVSRVERAVSLPIVHIVASDTAAGGG